MRVPSATFEMLFTEAVKSKNTHYITRIPKQLLHANEQEYVDYINKCLDAQYVPEMDIVRQSLKFLPADSTVPLDILYESFTNDRRETYIAAEVRKYVEEIGTIGLVEHVNKLIDKTVIPNPQVIAYSQLQRESYEANIYRSSWHVPYFDEMTTGLNGGDFMVLYAPTKSYKTTLLKLFAFAAFSNKEDVLFCSQEQGVLSMAQQFDMMALSRAHNTLRAGIDAQTMTDLKKLQSSVSKFGSEIFITPQVKTVKELHEYIVSLNRPIKKIFIDGLNLMGSNSENSFSSLQAVCSELKEYANKNNVIIIVVTQANREGNKVGVGLAASHVAGSFAIVQYADALIALTPLEEDGKKFVYIRALLNRHGDDSTKLLLYVDYTKDGKMKIDIDKVKAGYDPEKPLISQQTVGKLKAEFEALTGLKFEDAMAQLGKTKADALASMAVLDEKVASDVEGAF